MASFYLGNNCWIALVEEAVGHPDKADAILTSAGTFVDCYRFRADILDSRGDWPGAQKAYADAVALAPAVRERPLRDNLSLLLCYRVARLSEFFPVRRVLQRLVVLGEHLFRVALLHEHIAPGFQRISPVTSTLISVLEL